MPKNVNANNVKAKDGQSNVEVDVYLVIQKSKRHFESSLLRGQ